MSINRIEKIITKTGVISLATLAVIGIIASLFGTMGIDIDLFVGRAVENIFLFILAVLGILVGFCFPASFLMNFSSIAASMVKSKRLKRDSDCEEVN